MSFNVPLILEFFLSARYNLSLTKLCVHVEITDLNGALGKNIYLALIDDNNLAENAKLVRATNNYQCQVNEIQVDC